MRILHIIYDDIGNSWLGGGGAVRTLEVYSRIVSRGHRVLVVCGKYPGAPDRRQRNGVRYRYVGTARSYMLSRLAFMLGAARLIKRGGYDIVIEDVSPYSPVGAPLWKPRSVPAVASVQNLSGRYAPDKYGPIGYAPRLVENPMLGLFTNYIAVSPGIAGELRERHSRDISVQVVPNGVDPLFFEAGPAEAMGSKYILSLGRIDVYQKGLDDLIQAFDIVASAVAGVKLVIAGGGATNQVDELQHLAKNARNGDRIRLLGPVERDRAARLMRGAVMFAMPSRYEAWPLTALEAGASGLPVVGFDIVGVRDAAPPFPGGHGLLVPQGDRQALAKTMIDLLRRVKRRDEIGRRGREWASKFTWDNVAEEQLRYYEQLVEAAG
jgi:glycosyltransferase involved in cell wall biosynthesis